MKTTQSRKLIRKFEVTPEKAEEGGFVDVTWECEIPDAVRLRTVNGSRTEWKDLADSGYTRIAVGSGRGRMTLTLVAAGSGRKETAEATVRIHASKGKKTSGRGAFSASRPDGIPRWQMWLEKMQARVSTFSAQTRCWWQSQSKGRKILWTAVAILWLYLLVSLFIPDKPAPSGLGTPPPAAVTA